MPISGFISYTFDKKCQRHIFTFSFEDKSIISEHANFVLHTNTDQDDENGIIVDITKKPIKIYHTSFEDYILSGKEESFFFTYCDLWEEYENWIDNLDVE